MARVKGGMNKHKKHKKILGLAKGYWGAKSKLFRTAKQAVARSMSYAFVGRKQKKRDYRNLWIARINAAVRAEGISYSRFMNGLKISNIDINRKMLADMAVNDPDALKELVATAKTSLGMK